jgi:hypothetical protein
MSISRNIVQAVRSLDPPGRFLDKDTITGLWHDIGHKKAVEKTSQALRDGAAMLRKQLSADLGDPTFLNAVFNDDDNINKTNEGDKNTKERENISIKTNGKENSKKDFRWNSAEKIKVVKVCFIDTSMIAYAIHFRFVVKCLIHLSFDVILGVRQKPPRGRKGIDV